MHPIPGQQRIHGDAGLVDPNDDVCDVSPGFDAVEDAGGDDGEQHGEVLPGLVVAHEQRVFPEQRDDAQGAFADVVVERDLGVVEEDAQRSLLIQRISERFAERAAGAGAA